MVGAAKKAGIAAGILTRDGEHADQCLDAGFTFVGIGSDASLLASTIRAVTGKRR